jgi:hypothetical protein
MSEKKVKTRIQQKHDIEANWITADEHGFTPMAGELIIYDIESDAEGNTLTLPEGRTTPYTYERLKIGDGKTTVDKLPFVISGDGTINDMVYSNSNPTVSAIGGVGVGQTFENVPITDVLTMLLYPYIDLEIGSITRDTSETANITSGTTYTYYVHNIPTLNSVTLTLKKNSAKNLSFSLYRGDTLVSGPLTETNIKDNKLTFKLTNEIIDTSRTFTIKYSYTGDGNTKVESSTTGKYTHVNVGTFTISFQTPSKPTITHTVAKNSASGKNNAYYCGETADITGITTKIINLNSAGATGGITKLELFKNNNYTSPLATITPPAGSTSLDLGGSGKAQTFLSTTTKETLTSAETSTTTYTVRAHYKTRTGDSTETSPATIDSSNLAITFTYQDPIMTQLNITGGTFSKLNPQSISNPFCTFKKNSGKITQVKLLEGSTVKNTQSVSGLDGATYSATENTKTFEYTASNICSDKTFYAKAYNGDNEVASKRVDMTFYSPYCWGFVDANTTFDSINLSTLEGLAKDWKSQQNFTTNKNITITGPSTQKKFLFVAPGTSFTKVTDPAGNDAMTSFEKGGQTKTITFADGKTTQSYQIFLAAKAAADAAINYTFS